MLLLVAFAPWAAVGQSLTLTVCDGTNNNQHVPFEAFRADNDQHNQMIFPATDLAAMNGQNITQMVFYIDKNASSSLSSYDDLGTWTISLGETSATTLNGLDKTTALTQVFQGELNYQASTFSHSAGTLTIPIDEYIYHGGNLLVDLNHATSKHNYTWYFLGQSQSGVTAISSSPKSASTHQFLPKTTFSYQAPPTNPKPSGLTCSTYTANTATFVWTENGNATMWDFAYRSANNNYTTIHDISTPYMLTGLTPELTYYVKVRARYSDNTTSEWSLIYEFKPSAVHIVEIGLPYGTSEQLPTKAYYNYSYTQQIYTTTEIDQQGTIKSVSFKSDETGTRNLVVYMANTTKESFANESDVIPISEAQQVFSGNVDFTADEWTKITLSGNGFDYTGDNLAIIVDDNSGNYFEERTFWSAFTASSNQAVFFYQDDEDINPANPDAEYNGTTTSKNHIKLDIVPTTFPKPTNLAASNITTDCATIAWQAHSSATPTGYEYMYKAATGTWPDSWTSNQNQTSVNLTGLSTNTTYNFRVRAIYGTDYSLATETNFTTNYEAIATFPWVENFNGLTENNSIPDLWDNSEGTTIDDNDYYSFKWSYNNETYGNGATNGTSHDGSKCVRFSSRHNLLNRTNFLKTPILSLPANEQIQLSFWWKNPKGGDFSVYISTDGGETYETALATGLTNQTTWTQRIIDLTGYAGQEEVVIVFKGTSNQGLNDAYIYLDDVMVSPFFTTSITGHGGNSGNWHLIASPINGTISANDVTNLINTNPADFDLYRFNPSAALEWENWKQEGEHYQFTLANGQGYLYATKETKTLVFSGTFNTDGEKTIENLPAGFNLVGNPFPRAAWVSKSYYTLNGDGSAILSNAVSTATPISPCQGVIVEAGNNESVTFTTTAPAQQNANNNGGLQIALSQANTRSNALLDNAIVSFNEGAQLGKFYFGTQNANVYIPQDGKDYAIVSTEMQGEIPVNFKAKVDGEFTISVNPENVELAYLHLIDKMTGADVDLLSPAGSSFGKGAGGFNEPSYSFSAKATDSESRFKLVFRANNELTTSYESFAYLNNGNIVLACDYDNATMQIVDVLGRVIRQEAASGQMSASGIPAGVYVLRLINKKEMKVQKIVIQ